MVPEHERGDATPARLAGWSVGPWYLHVGLLAVVGGLSAAQRSGMGAGFVAVAGVPLVAATLGLRSMWLRVVRLTGGGMAAVSGAVLSLQLGFMVTVANVKDDTGLSGALFFALVFAGAGAWIADLRLAAREAAEQRARDMLATRRHDEVLARLGAATVKRNRIRLGELVLLAVAQRVLRRR